MMGLNGELCTLTNIGIKGVKSNEIWSVTVSVMAYPYGIIASLPTIISGVSGMTSILKEWVKLEPIDSPYISSNVLLVLTI